MIRRWHIMVAGLLAFCLASFFIVMGVKHSEQSPSCVINYNGALADIPVLKLRLDKLEKRIEELEK